MVYLKSSDRYVWFWDPKAWRIVRVPRIGGGMDSPAFEQSDFQFFNDDGNEAASTSIAAIDTDISPNVDSDFDFQMRFLVKETAGNAGNNDTWTYRHDLNSTGFVNTTTATTVAQVISTNLTNLGETTQRIGSGTFLTPNDGQTTDGVAGGPNCDPAGNDEWEVVCSIRIISVDVSDTDTIDFEVTNAALTLESGQANPRLTVVKTAAAGWGPLLSGERNQLIVG